MQFGILKCAICDLEVCNLEVNTALTGHRRFEFAMHMHLMLDSGTASMQAFLKIATWPNVEAISTCPMCKESTTTMFHRCSPPEDATRHQRIQSLRKITGNGNPVSTVSADVSSAYGVAACLSIVLHASLASCNFDLRTCTYIYFRIAFLVVGVMPWI